MAAFEKAAEPLAFDFGPRAARVEGALAELREGGSHEKKLALETLNYEVDLLLATMK